MGDINLYLLSCCCGIIFTIFFSSLPATLLVVASSIVAGSGVVIARLFPILLKRIVTIFAMFLLGLCWSLLYIHWVSNWRLPPALEGKKLIVSGYIASIPKAEPHAIKFVLATKKIAAKSVHTKLQLALYQSRMKLLPGEEWQFVVKLKRPHGWHNPGGFYYEKYLSQHHLRQQLQVENQSLPRKNYGVFGLGSFIE